MSRADTSGRPAGPRRPAQRSLALRITLVALGVLIAAGVCSYAVRTFGLISGEEFSPETFRRRSFTYYELPLIGVQVTPIYRQPLRDPLARHLINKKYIVPAAGNTRWDLVVAQRSGIVPIGYGDAWYLAAYLEMEDDKDRQRWLQWTEDHPELAKILWPAVAEVARQRLYVFIPDMMQLARDASEPEQLQEQIDELLIPKYRKMAQIQEKLGQPKRAQALQRRASQLRDKQAEKAPPSG